MEGLSVTLRSGAASALLGVPAGELAGRAVPIDQLWSAEGTQALERMAETADAARRVALLEELLARRLSRGEATGQSAALEAVRLIAASGGQRALRDVAAAVGVGERRLQQLFHLQVGLSPRTFSRLARLRGCLRALRRCPAAGWAEVAANAGFYDQSHLINEFRALCGMTPSEFLAHSTSGSSKTTG
jgi:methylphosphotriester-DNA--protein-cysteine methyltransferase